MKNRFLSLFLALSVALAPTLVFAADIVQVPHSTSEAIGRDEGGFGRAHTSTGASGAIDLTLPDCTAAASVTSAPYEPNRSNIGMVFQIWATDQTISVLSADDTNTVFILDGSALTAGNEVDLTAGENAVFTCTKQDRWSVISAGGADGGAS